MCVSSSSSKYNGLRGTTQVRLTESSYKALSIAQNTIAMQAKDKHFVSVIANTKDTQDRINFKQLFQDANSPDVIKATLQALGYGLEWNRNRAGKTGKHSIFQKNGTWLYTDFSSGESATAYSLIKANNPHTATGERVAMLAGIMGRDVSAYIEPDSGGNTRPPQRRKQKAIPKPTQAPTQAPTPQNGTQEPAPLNIHGTATLERWGTAYGHTVAEHIRCKTGATVELLERYNVWPCALVHWNKYNGVEMFGKERPAYLYSVGNYEKIKRIRPRIRPNGTNQSKTSYVQSVQKDAAQFGYVFGLAQLPSVCRQIIICAGEDDVLAANSALNVKDVYAVCLSGEGATLTPELLAHLNERCSEVVIWYDNDATGRKQAAKWARRYGLRTFQINEYEPTCKDISDVVQVGGHRRLMEIWESETVYRATLARNGVTFSGIRIEFDKYLGEHVRGIIQIVRENERVQISAPTGAGKTFAIRPLLENPLLVGCECAILAVPTQDIARQQGIQTGIPVIIEGTTETEILEAIDTGAAIATFDSVHKLERMTNKPYLLILDESHLIPDAFSYRSKAVQRVMKAALAAKRSLLLSGTPNPLFAVYGYKHLEFQHKTPQAINVQPIAYKGGNVGNLSGEIARRHKPNSGVSLVRLNDIKRLEQYSEALTASGLKCTIIASKVEQYNNTPEHLSILKSGCVPDGIDVVLTTSKLDTGVSITTPIQAVHIINPETVNAARQFMARPRWNYETGENKNVTVYLYTTEERTRREGRAFDLEQAFRDTLDAAHVHAEAANRLHAKISTDATRRDMISNLVVFDDDDGIKGKFIPDIAGIMASVSQSHAETISYTAFLKELQALGCTVGSLQVVNILEASSPEKVEIDYKPAFDVLEKHELNEILSAVSDATRDRNLKFRIKESGIELPNTGGIIDAVAPELPALEDVAAGALLLIKNGMDERAAREGVLMCRSETGQYERQTCKMLANKAYMDKSLLYDGLDGLKIKLRNENRELRAALSKMIGQEIKARVLFGIVKHYCGHVQQRVAIERVRGMFDIEQVGAGKDRTYIIHGVETVQDFIGKKTHQKHVSCVELGGSVKKQSLYI